MLVFVNKLISYEYFCDKLDNWELDLLIQNIRFTYKNEWEIARWQVWSSIAPYLKNTDKNKSLEKLFPLSTDNNYDYEIREDISDEEKNTIIEMMNKFRQHKDDEGLTNTSDK